MEIRGRREVKESGNDIYALSFFSRKERNRISGDKNKKMAAACQPIGSLRLKRLLRIERESIEGTKKGEERHGRENENEENPKRGAR